MLELRNVTDNNNTNNVIICLVHGLNHRRRSVGYLSCSREWCGAQDVDGFLQQLDDVLTLIGELLHSLIKQRQCYPSQGLNTFLR